MELSGTGKGKSRAAHTREPASTQTQHTRNSAPNVGEREGSMAFSLGIGLTNECDLRCAHCYRPDIRVERLTLDDVRRVSRSIPVRSVNLGVGENGLHPDYPAILDHFWSLNVKTSITSNG